MTRKKIGSAVGALVTTRQTPHPVARPMNGTGVPVRVDAVYEVRELRPSGDGPWTAEAEKIAWTDEMSGYACIIRRAPQGGHLCGYVAVPPSHPLFGMNPYAFVGLVVLTPLLSIRADPSFSIFMLNTGPPITLPAGNYRIEGGRRR